MIRIYERGRFCFLISFVAVVILLCSEVFADQFVITADGKNVVLKDDGTWKYLEIPPEKRFNFRNTYWGMTKEQVKRTENAEDRKEKNKTMEEEDYYAFKLPEGESNIFPTDTIISYYFANNILVEANYYLHKGILGEEDKASYKLYKEMLLEKYGDPLKDSGSEYTKWETARTMISLKREEGTIRITYESKKLAKLHERYKIKQKLDEL